MFIGVHTNCHECESTRDNVERDGSGRRAYIVTASLSASLVENVTEFRSNTVNRRVSDPSPLTAMKGTLFSAATKSRRYTSNRAVKD